MGRLRSGLVRESRALAVLAVPLAVTQLAQVALTTTDTAVMGLVGAEALAAGGLAVVLFNQLRTIGVGLVTAVGNQVAAATAHSAVSPSAVRSESVRQVRGIVRASFVVATVAGGLGAAAMVGLTFLLTFLGQDGAVVEAARPVVVAMAPGLLPCLWFQVLRQLTVGMGRPKALVSVTIASIAVNAGLDLVFVYGLLGLPRLGLLGIGLATSIVHLLSFVALGVIVRCDPVLAPALSLRAWAADRETVRTLIRLGVPIGATYGSEAGFFSVVALLMGAFGPAALAAHTVVNQLVYVAFQVSVGLSHAASILVSRSRALDDPSGVRQVVRAAYLQGAGIVTVVGLVYLLAPDLVLSPFLDGHTPGDAAATAVAVPLLVVAAIVQFADSAQNIGVGLLRGMQDTVGGFRMTILGYWFVGLPAAWVIGPLLGGGPVGVWCGLGVGLATTALLLGGRFRRECRRRWGPAWRQPT